MIPRKNGLITVSAGNTCGSVKLAIDAPVNSVGAAEYSALTSAIATSGFSSDPMAPNADRAADIGCVSASFSFVNFPMSDHPKKNVSMPDTTGIESATALSNRIPIMTDATTSTTKTIVTRRPSIGPGTSGITFVTTNRAMSM